MPIEGTGDGGVPGLVLYLLSCLWFFSLYQYTVMALSLSLWLLLLVERSHQALHIFVLYSLCGANELPEMRNSKPPTICLITFKVMQTPHISGIKLAQSGHIAKRVSARFPTIRGRALHPKADRRPFHLAITSHRTRSRLHFLSYFHQLNTSTSI